MVRLIMKKLFGNKASTIVTILITVIMAGVAIFTAIKLYQLRQQSVSPNAPSRSRAASLVGSCTNLTFNFGAASCVAVKVYDSSGSPLTSAQFSDLANGTKVNFCVSGTGSGKFDKARFEINGTLMDETTATINGVDGFCQEYTIKSSDTTITIKARIHNTQLGWFGENI